MQVDPDITQALWEGGSAILCLKNVAAIRKSRAIAGVHWLPTAYFAGWGVYNLWFYTALHLPYAYWAGLAITIVNAVWLGHVGLYAWRAYQVRKVFQGIVAAAEWEARTRPHNYSVVTPDGRDQ